MDLKTKVGHRIKAVRKARRINQEKLAEAIEMSHDTISRVELGKTDPSLDLIEVISNALDIEASELFADCETLNRSDERKQIDLEIRAKTAGLSDRECKRILELINVSIKN